MYYREYNEATGYYEPETLTKEVLIEQLMDDAVDEIIEIDRGQIERAISFIPQQFYRECFQNYIDYLERMVESLE